MFYLSTYLQWFASCRWKNDEQDDKSAFAVPKGPFHVNSQEVVKAPAPIFLKFYSNSQNIKRFVRYLGSNLAWNEKTRKVGYLCRLGYPWLQWKFALKNFSHIHYDMTSSPYKIHEWFSMFSHRKNWQSLCKNYKFCINTQVLIFTIFHYTIVLQASIATSQIHY